MNRVLPILIFSFTLNFLSLHAQNLVIDPGFESVQHKLETGTWINVHGTPDLYDIIKPDENLNFGLCKSIDPFEGNQTLGLLLVHGANIWNCKIREFIRGTLTVPLEKGITYRIKVQVRMANLKMDDMYDMTDIGILLSSDEVEIDSLCASRVPFLPLRAKTKVISSNGEWQQIENEYTAKGGEQYITIGGFMGASYHSLASYNGYKTLWSYFFFDAISITKINNHPEETTNESVPKLTITDKQILFASNSSEIDKTAIDKIKQIIKYLEDHTNYTIEIHGHTDNVGSDSFNQNLSANRANSVKKVFLNNGIPEHQIEVFAYGSSKNTFNNDTEHNRYANRKVEIVIRF